MWCNYFGKLYLPGVKLVNAGNDAVQLNFTRAFAQGEPCPPQENIDSFVRIAHDLVDLAQVDAILITCSTMNRSYPSVANSVNVPVVQIDMPMMEAAINYGGKILVIATLVTTVNSTQALLVETAQRMGKTIDSTGVTLEDAWLQLAQGNIETHNGLLAKAIREAQSRESIGCVVLAQLSMTIFAFSFPDPVAEFGVPVSPVATPAFNVCVRSWLRCKSEPRCVGINGIRLMAVCNVVSAAALIDY